MSGSTQASPAQMQANLQAQNIQARNLIRAYGLEMVQPIYSATIVPGNQSVINVLPRNVGLLRGFWVEVQASMYSSATGTALTKFGPANLLSQIAFTDLNGQQRIQTSGWHLALLDAIRKGYPFPGTWTPSTVIAYGNTFAANIYAAPAALPTTAPASPNVRMLYYVPLSYTKDDLRGAIYGGVTNATMQLQLTLNTVNWNVINTGDPLLAVYTYPTGNTQTWSNVTISVYQDYIDQIPSDPKTGGPILPALDMSTVYEIKNTFLTGVTANTDFPMPYSNFRQYLSTFAIYDNGGVQNSGSDVQWLKLQAANFTNILQADPYLWSQWTRDLINVDLPPGVYYLDSRRRPIDTNQFGNMQLLLTPLTGSNASVYLGYEDFAQISQVALAGSLPGS